MIKKVIKSILLVLVMTALLVSAVACGEDNGSTAVTLKTPGTVISNGGAVIETQNYYYFVNGAADSSADNEYGTPIKGSIMVVNKADMKTQEIVVPKIVSSSDYNAGIYLYGEYLYYGTTTTKKGTDGQVATNVLEFQKAKIDGSGVSEILTVDGLGTEFRFIENDGVVYLVYKTATTVDGENVNRLVSLNTATGAETVIVEGYENFTFITNEGINKGSKVAVLYTKTVEKYPDVDGNDETETYNELYAYKVGESTSKLVRTGKADKTGLVNNVTYSIAKIIDNYAIIATNDSTNSAKSVSYDYIALDTLYTSTADTQKTIVGQEVKNEGHFDALVVSFSEIYYVDATTSFLVKAGFDKESRYDVPVANVAVTKLLGVYDGRLYYTDENSFIYSVELSETEIKEPVVVIDNSTYADWYKTVFTSSGHLFYNGSTDLDRYYVRAIDLANLDYDADVNEEEIEGTTVYKADQDKIIKLGKYTDEDYAKFFEASLVVYRDSCKGDDMRVKVRDDNGVLIKVNGEVTTQEFVDLKAEYAKLTDAQKEYLSADAVDAYDLYIRCVELNTKLSVLEGFNNSSNKDSFSAKATEVKAYIEQCLTLSDYEDVFNMADNNLLWEYFGGNETDGAYEYFFGTND